ncbi:MAG TPA: tetratricopeptide repeat protein, partial [Aquificaceae bacterium]|nr:tetratricopeptide repeat protein [Aquificaceae bacterium]
MRKFILTLSFFGFSLSNSYFDALMCSYSLDKPQVAEVYCLRAIEGFRSPELYKDTIKVLLRQKKYGKAEEIAKEFLQVHPNEEEAYIYLYNIYKILGKDEKALKVIEEAYKSFPYDVRILLFLVDEYLKGKDIDKAKKILKEYLNTNPNSPLPYYLLGRVYIMEGNTPKGIEFFEKALKIHKYYAPAVLSLGGL